MKRIFLIFLVLNFLVNIFELKAQQKLPVIYKENVTLFTDRNLYVTGEEIYFSAFLNYQGNQESEVFSHVIYIELITPGGLSFSRGKFMVKNNKSSGVIAIPQNINSGIYYLKAYTKSMRNFDPENYSYTCLKIVNPRKQDVLAREDTTGFAGNSIQFFNAQDINKFEITTDKTEYSTREAVNFRIKFNNSNKDSIKGMCLSVVPEFSAFQQKLTQNTKESKTTKFKFIPETRGVSLTGSVIDNTTGLPMRDVKVNLSVIGNFKDYMAVQTDSAGHFFFSMPDYKKSKDIFISTKDIKGYRPSILVDNDFCENKVTLPSPIFSLTEEERKIALQFAANKQVQSKFIQNTEPLVDTLQNARAFYGEPTEVLVLDNYIQLPTLEEYFAELVVSVNVRKHKGEKHIKVLGNYPEMEIFSPLVLVDYVAIEDIKKVLGISPENISRIEVVNSPYIIGNDTHGGIINILSKKGDYAGIELPSSGLFLNFNFWSENPNNLPQLEQHDLQPDTRNTLLWVSDFNIKNIQENKTISFKTSDTPGNYQIIIQSVDSEGKILTGKANFKVK